MATNPNDGAFATPTVNDANGNTHWGEHSLTKREWFAGLAMQEMLASGQMVTGDRGDDAMEAVRRADALIAALNEGGQ